MENNLANIECISDIFAENDIYLYFCGKTLE
jgi:hypothetical protein